MSFLLKIIFLLLAGIYVACGQEAEGVVATNAPPNPTGTNFQSFRLITDRNIFNQNRSPRLARRETTRTRPAPKMHSLSLVGTMSYAKGDFAFFDGSNPDYRKPVKPGEKIAGYQVKEITSSTVRVASETQEFEMKIGQQLRREEEGPWELTTGPREPEAAAVNEAGAEKTSTGAISEEEAVKRLMEKRAKELNP